MSLLLPLNLHHFGYLGLYLSLALGIMGIPVPDEGLMLYVGFLIYRGYLSPGASIAVALLGSISGMSISFFIGRGIFSSLGKKFEARHRTGYAKYQKILTRYGGILITVGYFFPLVRHLTAYSSGLLKMKYSKFLLCASIGALLWVTTFILLGYAFGQEWVHISRFIVRYKAAAITAAVIYSAALLYFGGRKINSGNI